VATSAGGAGAVVWATHAHADPMVIKTSAADRNNLWLPIMLIVLPILRVGHADLRAIVSEAL
jgi:hypothetical protein